MTEPRSGTPGTENMPQGDDDAPSVGDRTSPGAPPPGSNQAQDETLRRTSDATEQSGTVGSDHPASARGVATHGEAPGAAHRQPDREGQAPPGAMSDDDELGAARTSPGSPPDSRTPDVFTPGHTAGVSAPSVEAAQGTSEDADAVTGIRATALAPPGSPDGEVDTRR